MSGYYASEYEGTLDTSGLTQDEVWTAKVVVDPVVGDADSVFDSSVQTVNRSNVMLGQCNITFYGDKNDTATVTRYVSTSGNDTTGDGSNGNPWATVHKALTDGTADDIECAAGTYTFGAVTAPSSLNRWRTIRPASGASVTISLDGLEQPNTPHLRFQGVTISKATQNVYIYDSTQARYVWYDGVTTDTNSQAATATAPALAYGYAAFFTDCTIDDFKNFGLDIGHGSIVGPMWFDGNTMDSTANASCKAWVRFVANDADEIGLFAATGGQIEQDPCIIEFNKIHSWSTAGAANISLFAATACDTGASFVGNIVERTAGTNPTIAFAAGGTDRATNHVLFWHNTFAGERANLGYNEAGTVAVYANRWGMVGNSFEEYNIKSDLFPTASGNRIGNWANLHGVGFVANAAENTLGFCNAYPGLYSSTIFGTAESESGTTPCDPAYTDDQSFTTTGSGDGDYLPTDAGDLWQALPSGWAMVPKDMLGNEIPDNGTGHIGAIQSTAPTTWYIKTGESGNGTSLEDYAGSWAAIASNINPNDDVSIHGSSILREFIEISDTGVTVYAEPGTGMYTVTGRRLIEAADWAVHVDAGGSGRIIYKEPIDAPSGFVYNYRFANVEDADGNMQSIPIGHIPQSAAANLTAFIAEIAAGDVPSWFHNGTNIYVYFPNNDDPRSSGLTTEWLENPAGTGFRVSADSVEVSDFRLDCCLAPDASTTYWGFQLNGVQNCYIHDFIVSDCYYHSAGATGGICVNNIFENFICYTTARGTDSHLVQYCNSGTLSGCKFITGTIHLSDLRDYAGNPLDKYAGQSGVGYNGDAAIKGIAGHVGLSATGIAASGLIYNDITIVDYADCHTKGTQAYTFSGGAGSAPSDRNVMTDYQIVIQDSTLRGAIGGQAQADGYAGFIRCFEQYDGTVSGGISQANIVISSGGAIGKESCTIVGEMSSVTNNVIFRVGDNLTLSNCSIHAAGDTDGLFFVAAGTDLLKITHSILDRENAGYLCKGGGMNTPVVTNNWYSDNINDTQFAVPGAFNTQTEWEALDTGGNFDVDFSSEFSNLPTLQPSTVGTVWTTRSLLANTDKPRGINNIRYGGTVGAWQRTNGSSNVAIDGLIRLRRKKITTTQE